MKGFYVAATNQHVGKTTSTLGLAAIYRSMGYNVGYCKPVGQHFIDLDTLRVDKDTLLFADLLGFKLQPDYHSPVILGSGATTAFLDHPEKYNYREDVMAAAKYLHENHELVIYEGTGHPGVGSVVNLSNADVANILDLGVVMIVEGGIGNTIDQLNTCSALFREKNVPIVGVIVNKVLPEKMEKVKYYVSKKLHEWNLKPLGFLPYDKSLAFKTIKGIIDQIKGTVTFNEEYKYNKVEDIISGSVLERNQLQSSQKNLLLVVAADRVDNAINKVKIWSFEKHGEYSPLSGIVATGEGLINSETEAYILKNNIPFIRTHLDTLGTVTQISKMEVKINLKTPWKIQRAIELIKENVDLDYLQQSVKKM